MTSDDRYTNHSLFSEGGIEITPLEKTLDLFLNRSIMLYGSSNSGKSTIIKDMLFMLKDHIPNILVICPTNKLNHSYNGIVPDQLILDNVDEKLMIKILKRQDFSVKIYNMVNDIDTLEQLWNKMYRKDERALARMQSVYDNICHKLSDQPREAKELEKQHKNSLIVFYKKVIFRNRKYLNKCRDLSENDTIIIKHININPNLLLIIDDAAVSATTWSKYESVKELFFNGRHHHITFMIAFQDDKMLDPSLRKNAFINIFTTEKVSVSYFERSANNFSRVEKRTMTDIAKAVFNDKKLKNKNYRKLVYIKDSFPSSYYMIADLVDDFMFGSKSLIEFCDKIKRKDCDNELLEFSDFFT